MTLRKRMTVLEGRHGSTHWDRPPVLIGLVDTADADVIGIRNGSRVIERNPGETLDDMIARIRTTLATPWAGLPLIMTYAYSDDVMSRAEVQP